ncbi:MAG: hypothetical protein O2894_04940 [Planctomycetota bacterium]|nr:hypothetical protein [Planctomycetota bacterium]
MDRRAFLVLALAASVACFSACGDGPERSTPSVDGHADGTGHAEGTHAGAGHAHADDPHAHESAGHAHGEGGHEHAADEVGPPPIDVGPAARYGPHDGVLARLSHADEPDYGFVELKLHEDKGDLELWLARDALITLPLDLPVAAEVRVAFLDRDDKVVVLRARDDKTNPDEDGVANVRDGATHYFIFPGESGADAAWLQGRDFRAVVRVSFVWNRAAYVSDDFELRPHGAGHGHAHDK